MAVVANSRCCVQVRLMLLTTREIIDLTGRRSRILCRSGKPAGQPTHMSTPAAARMIAIRIRKSSSSTTDVRRSPHP
jgi:hypothetical protein